IQARYELLPRGHYTYNKPLDMEAVTTGVKLPFDQYEALLEVYQAQNAVQIAQSLGAAEYAAETYNKAVQLLSEAHNLQAQKAGANVVVTTARQAAQTAEDARAITVKRKQDAQVSQAQAQVAAAQQEQAEAEAAARAAQEEAAATRARLEAERAAREQADRVAAPTPPPPPSQPPLPQAMIEQPQRSTEPPATELRQRLLQQLNSVLPTRDTPRGLVVTLSDAYFHSTTLNPAVYSRLTNLASIVRSQPGLMLEVDGHTDDRGDPAYAERVSLERASMIRNILVRQGLGQGSTVARGMGRSRPIASNATAAGREQNRRVEITISGAPIGNTASWDRSYSLAPR